MMRNLLFVLFITLSIASSAQKPANGTYLFKFFDLEYARFHGICTVVVKGDSIKVIAKEDCHRILGQLICEGTIKKGNDGNWNIIPFIKSEKDDFLDRVNFKKKIFYTY